MAKTSTERSRKCREKLKNDPDRLARLRENDKLRKREARSKPKSLKRQEELRQQRREHMKRWREKKKLGQAKPTAKEIGGKKASRIVKRRTQSKKASAERKLKAEKKKIAVLRTQAWRLRLRLVEESTNRRTKETEAKASSGFTSYSAERRTLRKVKDVLPQIQ